MPAVTMLDRLVESGLSEMIAASVTGFQLHLSHDLTEKVAPFIVIQATLGDEQVVPGSGLFEVPVEITMAARADDMSADAFGQKSAQLLQVFYHNSSAASRLSLTSGIGSARALRCHATGSRTTVDNEERLYIRTLTLTVMAYPNSVAS